MAVGYNPKIVTDGIVLCLDVGNTKSYPGSGTTWSDLSGNSNNAYLVNGVGYASADGGALTFDGTNDYVREDTILDTFTATTDSWSVECWFNTDVNPSIFECMIGINYNGQQNTLLLGVVNNGGTCNIKPYYNNSDLGTFGDLTVTVGQWHHVMATHTSGSLKLYFDKIEIASSSNTVNQSLNSCAFLIGAELDNGNSLGNYFDGKISNVKMYSKTLTAAEVTQNFNALKGRYGL